MFAPGVALLKLAVRAVVETTVPLPDCTSHTTLPVPLAIAMLFSLDTIAVRPMLLPAAARWMWLE